MGDFEEGPGPGSVSLTGPERLTKAGDAGFGQITPRATGPENDALTHVVHPLGIGGTPELA